MASLDAMPLNRPRSGSPATLVTLIHEQGGATVSPMTRGRLQRRETRESLRAYSEDRSLLRAVRLPGSGFRRFTVKEGERLRAEMFEPLAPPTEGPVVQPDRKRRGRFIFGDTTE